MKRGDKGSSIRVGIRVRPLNKREIHNHDKEAWIVKPAEGNIQASPFCQKKKLESYTFDNAFGLAAQTHTVYDESCASIIDSAFEGETPLRVLKNQIITRCALQDTTAQSCAMDKRLPAKRIQCLDLRQIQEL